MSEEGFIQPLLEAGNRGVLQTVELLNGDMLNDKVIKYSVLKHGLRLR